MPGQNRDKIYSKCRFLENYMADSQTINLRENEKSNPSLSAINAENQQIVKQAPNFTPKIVKLGAFVLFKIYT